MASPAFVLSTPYRRLSLATIDAVVSARLGPTRVQGNAQPACFNRQIAMYLAKHVAGWSTTCIGRYYHGRDHSTVIHGIQRIEALRENDPEVHALVSELKDELARQQQERDREMKAEPTPKVLKPSAVSFDDLADAIAERIWAVISGRLQK
jgi:Bacterial dnaA protein helix-turn-helix